MNRGGKRRGAGRKPSGERAGVTHAKRPRLAARFPVLVTLRMRGGLPSVRERSAHELVRAAFAKASVESFRVIEYSVQSNHLHVLVEAKDERALSSGMMSIGVRIARGLNVEALIRKCRGSDPEGSCAEPRVCSCLTREPSG